MVFKYFGLHLAKVENEVTDANRSHIRAEAKKHLIGKVIVDTYPGMAWEDFDHEKFLHLKAAFLEFLNSKTTPELYTMIEIENLLRFAKKMTLTRMQRKLASGNIPDEYEIDYLLKLCDRLINLHKLKHGEKHIIAKMDFSYIRDL